MKSYSHYLFITFAFLTQLACSSARVSEPKEVATSEPSLVIKQGTLVQIFSRSELLKSADLVWITIENGTVYPKHKMTYQALPLATLFRDFKIADSDSIDFTCVDGFSAPMSAHRLLGNSAKDSVAYLAIEPANEPWPPLKTGKPLVTAGPFYLIWKNPKLSQIGKEEWPFQLAGFEIKPSVTLQFPQILPDSKFGKDSRVFRGYEVFLQNCFSCHTMNGQGISKMGPDLNFPFNPTEYFRTSFLEKLVRNPRSLRTWPDSKMPSFDRSALSDPDLNSLVQYFAHMASRKSTSR